MGHLLLDDLAYRTEVLVDVAKPNLMDTDEAHAKFRHGGLWRSRAAAEMNKQKGEKAGPGLLWSARNPPT